MRAVLLSLFVGITVTLAAVPQTRVLGGENTVIENHPYQLALEYHNAYYCGATLIRRNIALTVAHAFEEEDSLDFRNVYRIRAGSSFRNTGGQLASINDVRVHPQFDSQNMNFDIAVVKMCDCLDYSPSFYRIDMVNAGGYTAEGSIATLTGFGRLYDGGEYAPVLQSANAPVLNQQRCVNAYAAINVVTNNMICAGSFEGLVDACGGDSGSPLAYNGQLIGIVSWGNGCGIVGFPGVYTSISALRPWIETQLY